MLFESNVARVNMSLINQNKEVRCQLCSQKMRSDNLKRHMKRKDHQLTQETASCSNEPELDKDVLSDDSDTAIGKYAWKDKNVQRNHSHLLPRDIRAIVVGKSGVGKTCLVTYLLLSPDMLDYDHLTICGRSLHQPEYRIMKSAFSRGWSKNQVNALFGIQDDLENVEKFIEDYKGTCKGGLNVTFNEDPLAIPDPSEHDPECKNLLILDDCMLGPQSKVLQYYVRGRHNSVDTIYITQSYFRLDRTTIRENANLFIFFKQDNKNLSHIYQDHCAVDGIPYEDFKEFCSDVWNSGKYNFVTLDLTRPVNEGKIRKNLDEYWTPMK